MHIGRPQLNIRPRSFRSAREVAPLMAQALLMKPTVFHPGEQLVQERVGVREHVKASGMEEFVRPFMPGQHRLFFEQQPLLYLGSRDSGGRPWATVVAGRPGFLSTPDDRHLKINHLKLPASDPLAASLVPGTPVGMLGMELHTRRRNRLNGIISGVGSNGNSEHQSNLLVIDVSQSFGNCPKYIQGRMLDIDFDALDHPSYGSQQAYAGGAALGPDQRRIVERADTFLIASCFDGPTPADVKTATVGYDVSHRGGPPGFIQVSDSDTKSDGVRGTILRWADYKGNNMFQTLGNLLLNPKAGILIIDFHTGDTLHLTGEATINFEDTSLPGALRTVSFRLHNYVHVVKALPLRQVGEVDWSPFLPAHDPVTAQVDSGKDGQDALGEAAATAQAASPQLLDCVSVVHETPDVATFEFKLPAGVDAGSAYQPGQFATFEFLASAVDASLPASSPPVVRTWTVSSHPSWTARTGTFTISVKRVGSVSGLLHRTMQPGSTVLFRAFGGDFVPGLLPAPVSSGDTNGGDGSGKGSGGGGTVLLLAAGIGITPMRAMMHDFALKAAASAPPAGPRSTADSASHTSQPGPERLVLFYSIRHLEDAAFVDELTALARDATKGAQDKGQRFTAEVVLTVTQANAEALAAAAQRWPGVEVHAGRLSASALIRHGGGGDGGSTSLALVRGAFMCGPPGFMAAVEAQLEEAGLSAARLFSESFSF